MNLHIDNDTCHEIIFTQGGVSHSLDKLYYNEHLVWEKQSQHDYSQDYFTIESLEDNNDITFKANNTPPSLTLYYSTDDGTTWSAHSEASSKQWVLNTGDKILLKATATQYGYYYNATDYYWSFVGTKTHKVYGNIMSLLYDDNFIGQTSLSSNYAFYCLFRNNNYLVDASNLILPATTLTERCYSQMFRYCTSLVNMPALPATSLQAGCYYYMFQNCTSLVNVKDLIATTLIANCYGGMFYNCTSLVKAPEIYATTTAPYCCTQMFYKCTSLGKSPILRSTTLTSSCYSSMFYGCTSLSEVICLATDISAEYCLFNWTNNVASTGDFYKAASMSSWPTGTSGIPSGWTVSNYTN